MISIEPFHINNNHNQSFIGSWKINDEQVLDNALLVYQMSEKKEGLIGKTIDKGISDGSIKQSFDVTIDKDNINPLLHGYMEHLASCVNLYIKRFKILNHIPHRWSLVENFNIQRYPIGGGFKKHHCERSGVAVGSKRLLVFMTYLNTIDVEGSYEGGTIFLYQRTKVKCIKGLTLIWPADWTHTHRGIVSNSSEKTIITGWFGFE